MPSSSSFFDGARGHIVGAKIYFFCITDLDARKGPCDVVQFPKA
jgi:hypothetical protein